MTDSSTPADRPGIVGVWEFTQDQMDLLSLQEGDLLGMAVVGPPRTEPYWHEQLLDRVDDAIETVLLAHESLDNDSRCSCGVRNNMDGDVLHGHRVGAVSAAVRRVLDPAAVEGGNPQTPARSDARCHCGHRISDHNGNYSGSRACDHCPCPGCPQTPAGGTE